MRAGRKALQDGASKKAAVEAAKKAGKEAAARAIKSGTSKKQADRVADGVVKTVEKDGRRFIAQEAMRKKQSELFESAAKRSLKTNYSAGRWGCCTSRCNGTDCIYRSRSAGAIQQDTDCFSLLC